MGIQFFCYNLDFYDYLYHVISDALSGGVILSHQGCASAQVALLRGKTSQTHIPMGFHKWPSGA